MIFLSTKNYTIPSAVIFLFVLNGCFASEKTIKYISIGLRIGYIDDKRYTFGGKISAGINYDYNFSGISRFVNVTVGFKVPIFRKQTQPYEEYNFIQFQYGDILFPDNLFHFCGGAGMIFYHDKNKIIYKPMASLYVGSLLFVGCDYVFQSKKNIITDFGLLVSMPVIIKGYKFGLQ